MVNYPVLLIAIPLLVSFLLPLFKRYASSIALGALSFNMGLSIALFFNVYGSGKIYEIIAGFVPPIGIFLAIDSLSALMAFIINLSFLNTPSNISSIFPPHF